MKYKRIIFVGLHNKSHMQPLDSHTKSGKLIDRIIKELPKSISVVKTNLFDVDRFPHNDEMDKLKSEWFSTYLPTPDDVIVLLGKTVHEEFEFKIGKILKIAHPASKRSHADIDEYVSSTLDKIAKSL